MASDKEEFDPEKEERMNKIRQIALSYYSRKDVQQAIFDFCKSRETVPRYFEGFGKRPDMLDYSTDLVNYVKNGATSFHCSEELWENPLNIITGMSTFEANQKRIGWDFLIDIDSKYFDYSRIAAELMIRALEYHGITNIGIKFSGSKGMHIIIPWKAFPKEYNGEKTSEKFPEWPRIIAAYLNEMIHDKLTEEIFKLTNIQNLEEQGKEVFEIKCKNCNQIASTQKVSKYLCNNLRCKSQMTNMKSTRKTLMCPSCKADMTKVSEQEYYFCDKCKQNSNKNPKNFEKKPTAKALIDSVDIVLVSSRHLFRVPYSLHEKTRLASVVINKEDIKNFNPLMADPLKIKIKDFLPNSSEGEAKELLSQALDWQQKKVKKVNKEFNGESINLKNLEIKEEYFPDCIKKILIGIKQDGRKRALFILLAFLRSLEMPRAYIEDTLDKWNKKNYKPLLEGYLTCHLDWFEKNKILPPNCGSHYYKELGLSCNCDVKNPLSFTIKKALQNKGRKK